MALASRKTNWFAIWVSIAVVAILAVVAVVVVAINDKPAQSGAEPVASNIDTATGAIRFGSGKSTMDTYIDFMCPICNEFEKSYGPRIQELISENTVTLRVHPIAILDRNSQGTQYSSRAAGAMYSVAAHDPDHAYPFLQAMYAHQPKEGSPGLTDDEILTIAKDAGVTVTTDLDKEIKSHKYVGYVESMTPKTPIAPGSAGIGTPTISINGETIALSALPAPDQLATRLQ
jgi:protein-disulfide isomerase